MHEYTNIKKKDGQYTWQLYRSNSVLLNSAVHCPRWFLSVGSRRLHSVQ